MKPWMSILCAGLVLATTAVGQTRQLDSLQQELKRNANNPAAQLDAYVALSRALRGTDAHAAILLSRQGIEASRAANLEYGLSRMYGQTGFSYSAYGDQDQAMEMADSAIYHGNRSKDFEGLFLGHTLKAEVLRKKGNFDEALPEYLESIKLAEKQGNEEYMAKAYNGIGVFYVNVRDLTRAEEYHSKALEIRLRNGKYREIWQSYENLGIIFRDLEEYDKALEYYKKAAVYAAKGEDSSRLAFSYNDIGAALSLSGRLDAAEGYLKKSIAIRERIHEYDELAYTYNYLGENYERKKELKLAEECIRKAILIAQTNSNSQQEYEAYESISAFFARNARYDSAYAYALRHKSLKDSVTSADQVEIIASLNAKFETEKKERKLREQELEITRRNYWIGGISGLFLLGGSLGFSGYRRYRYRQKVAFQREIMRQQELATRAVILAEENERRRIASDLHDGLGQMMSAARVNLSSLKTELSFNREQEMAFEKAVELIDESCREIRSVSHNIMPNALLKSGLASATREFISKIDHRVLQVNLFAEGLNERIEPEVENIVYRIIQEAVNNVIKHSGASVLDITLIREPDSLSVTIEDNGRGFDTARISKFDGIGLSNIQSRVNYLKGNVEWNSAPEKGTVVMVEIPLKS